MGLRKNWVCMCNVRVKICVYTFVGKKNIMKKRNEKEICVCFSGIF